MTWDSFNDLAPPNSAQIALVRLSQREVSKSIHIFHLNINKGTTLRLVNHLLDRPQILGLAQDSLSEFPPLEAIFGDSLPDVPMIRKDWEVKAFNENVSEEMLASSEQKLTQIFPDIGGTSKDQWWFFSGVPNKLDIHENDPWIETALEHPKVHEYGNMGLLSIMTSIEEELKRLPDLPE